MTNINFYVSKQDGIEHRLGIVYKLIGYALQRNLFTHVHTDDEAMSKQLDTLLWTREKSSFIPHRIITQEDNPTHENNHSWNDLEKITISHDHEPMVNCDYLINLSIERPAFFSRFTKLAEVIDNSDAILAAGRKRYVFYRDRGYTLAYHKL